MRSARRPSGHHATLRRLRLAPIVALAGLALAGCGAEPEGPEADDPEAPEARVPRGKRSDGFSNIALRTQHGEEVRFYDDLVKDKVVIINLMYTQCPKICPGTTANLTRLHDLFGERMGRDLFLLSLTIDPEVDDPAQLKRYWEAFGSRPGWLYLTGDYDEIDELRHQLGVYDPDPIVDADKTQHSGIVTFGNDRTDRWAALPALMRVDQMAETIVRFTRDDEWTPRRELRRLAAGGPEAHRARGILREIQADRARVVIEHEDIPDLMMAMTMAFEVPDWELVEGLAPGQAVDFSVVQREGRFLIVRIQARDG